jgi:hypothetical protein
MGEPSAGLMERVQVQDHGIVTTEDPETGEEYTVYQVSFFVTAAGREYGRTVASSPDFGPEHPAYEWMIRAGKMSVLEQAGLWP